MSSVFFQSSVPWPSSLKVRILRGFGAVIGAGVVVAPRVSIHMPWKLRVGDHSWIGSEVAILNLESVIIGSNACVSQRSFLCTGNHDYKSPSFEYNGSPISVGDGAWIGAHCFVGPGSSIGTDCVIVAGSVVLSDLPNRQICGGNPCVPIRPRVFHGDALLESE